MRQYIMLPAELRGVRAIVDFIDVDSEKWFRYAEFAAGIKRWLYSHEGERLRRMERELTQRASAVLLVSEAEAELWRRICPNDHTYAVSNGVDLDYFHPSAGNGRPERCVFVGALDYLPNVDGLLWFAKHVWPEVRSRFPSATFDIVGRNPRMEVSALAKVPGIEVIGTVPDVRPYLAQATVAVAPLRIARGVQNKVLEAMASGCALIASPDAIEGLQVRSDYHLRVASHPGEWVKSIVELFEDSNGRTTMAAQGRVFVEQHHDWSRCLMPLTSLLTPLAQSEPSIRASSSGTRATNKNQRVGVAVP
jgi:sugar transferase (PEP-CTERM/EpsH1 system associated)